MTTTPYQWEFPTTGPGEAGAGKRSKWRHPAPKARRQPHGEDLCPRHGVALPGAGGNRLIRRTAVVRTRMPGGVGGVAPRGVPLSRLRAPAHPTIIVLGMQGAVAVAGRGRLCRAHGSLRGR